MTNPIEALKRDRSSARSLQDGNADICFLALTDPSVRTLVTRDIDDSGIQLFINKTSAKWETIEADASAQVLFWFSSLQKQYRVSGTIKELGREDIENNWPRRPAGSKYLDHAYEDFARQSSVIESRDALTAYIGESKAHLNEEEMTTPTHATGVRLVPASIECLDLNNQDRIHDRRLFTLEAGSWQEQVLMP